MTEETDRGGYAAGDASATPESTALINSLPADPAPGHRGLGPRGQGVLGLHGALHGEFVIPKSGGGYQTVAVQRGAVTAVNSDSIALKSSDGFTRTYQVNADTLVNSTRDGIGNVKVDDQVRLVASVSGETSTALRIVDVSQVDKLRERMHGPRPSEDASAPEDATTSGHATTSSDEGSSTLSS